MTRPLAVGREAILASHDLFFAKDYDIMFLRKEPGALVGAHSGGILTGSRGILRVTLHRQERRYEMKKVRLSRRHSLSASSFPASFRRADCNGICCYSWPATLIPGRLFQYHYSPPSSFPASFYSGVNLSRCHSFPLSSLRCHCFPVSSFPSVVL